MSTGDQRSKSTLHATYVKNHPSQLSHSLEQINPEESPSGLKLVKGDGKFKFIRNNDNTILGSGKTRARRVVEDGENIMIIFVLKIF